MPMNMSGTRIVPITNDLVRTIASNSRLNTTNVSDMSGLDLANDVFRCAHHFQEYVLQRGLAVLEPLESYAGLDQLAQEVLRIDAFLQCNLRGGAAVPHALDVHGAAQIV